MKITQSEDLARQIDGILEDLTRCRWWQRRAKRTYALMLVRATSAYHEALNKESNPLRALNYAWQDAEYTTRILNVVFNPEEAEEWNFPPAPPTTLKAIIQVGR